MATGVPEGWSGTSRSSVTRIVSSRRAAIWEVAAMPGYFQYGVFTLEGHTVLATGTDAFDNFDDALALAEQGLGLTSQPAAS